MTANATLVAAKQTIVDVSESLTIAAYMMEHHCTDERDFSALTFTLDELEAIRDSATVTLQAVVAGAFGPYDAELL